MGASESLIEEYAVVESFNSFIKYINESNKQTLLTGMKPMLNKLKDQSEKFFATYTRLKEAKKIGGEGIDLNHYFQKIVSSVENLKGCVVYLINDAKPEDMTTITAVFNNDLRKFIKQVTQLSKIAIQLLETILSRSSPLLMTQFYLELSIFDYAINIQKSDKPPYYIMSSLPAYDLRDQIHSVKSKFINITAPHATGKTSLIPLHIACRELPRKNHSRFIIVVEHETANIHRIERVYRNIITSSMKGRNDVNEEDYEEEDDNEEDSLIVTTSYNKVLNLVEYPPYYLCIGVLSPFDALHLLHSVDDVKKFIETAIFVIDDVHLRTVETDVLVQDISRAVPRSDAQRSNIRIALMSTVADDQFLNFLGSHEDLKFNNLNNEVTKKEIGCSSISDIENRALFREMRDFFNDWLEKSTVGVGSVIVFVPSEKVGQRVFKEIYKYYSKDNSTNVCPLKTTIRRGERIDDFYNRLLADMTLAEGERKDKQTLFLLPINLNNNFITTEERMLIQTQLPLPFNDKLARVFITTIKNESILQINDLMVIFDTGVEEVEFYDAQQSSYHIHEQLLPKPFIEQHHKLLGQYGDGIYYQFNVKNKERPQALIPSVKRIDLGRVLLVLRSLGIKLEDQRNLPNEPNHEILDECFELLIKIGIIDGKSSKELTEIGKEAAKYSNVSPFFALATAKFKDNPTFAFLCSLIVENSRTLVLEPKSELLMKHFNRESDIVTLLETLCEVSEEKVAKEAASDTMTDKDKSGLSIGTVYSIYSLIESTFSVADGRSEVVKAVKWAQSQKGGILRMVDNFVHLLDENEFINKRKASFRSIVGAGPGNDPTIIYSANEVFQFKEKEEPKSRHKKSKEDRKDSKDAKHKEPKKHSPKIKFARRPGWIGLQCPGRIIVLSVLIDEEKELLRGLIVHHSTSTKNPGVVSFNVDNPSLNSFFFVSLFDAYWSDHSTYNDFVGINHSMEPNKESASLIHMTEDNGKTYLNYCPKNQDIEKEMKKAIPILSSLMPYVPRSVLAKVDTPSCCVEIIGYGTSNNYASSIHLIDENGDNVPIPFPVNKKTLDFCYDNRKVLCQTFPKIRFAITGESFYYKSIRGKEVECDLSYPDVNPSLASVFDPHHSSHLVLLVDKSLPKKPDAQPLAWLPSGKGKKKRSGHAPNDGEENKLIETVTSKIMTGMGYAERSADYFYVTLSGGYPTPGRGKIPDSIKGPIGYSEKEGNSIKNGIYPLVRHFLKEFSIKQKLTEPIQLKELSSTNSWKKCPKDQAGKERLCNQIAEALKSHFRLKEDDVQVHFLGNSMLAIRIEGLPSNIVLHRINDDVWDDSYQQCQADREIEQVLKELKTAKMTVSQVVHEPTISVAVWQLRRFRLSANQFEEKVKKIAENFGFLVSAYSPYTEGATSAEHAQIGVVGDIQVELIGMASGIAFASLVTTELQPKSDDDDFSMTRTMASCIGMATIRPDLGPAPTVPLNKRVVKIDPSEVDALKKLIAMKNTGQKRKKWNIDTNFNVLILPATEDAAIKEMMLKVRNKDEDTTCLFMCDVPQILLPQSLYVYQKDGSVRTLAVCQQCIVESFRSSDDLKFVIDPITKMVNRKKLHELENNLQGFPLIDSTQDGDGCYWPQIPIGQAIWTLMCDTENIAPYVKAWFTVVIDFIVRKASHYFTYCPNHPDIPYRTPNPGINLKCPHCNMFFCSQCRIWHKMSDKCINAKDGIKRCPNCRIPTFKTEGCNHITCPCGKHWCYKCDVSPIFNISDDCYAHMKKQHGGYFT